MKLSVRLCSSLAKVFPDDTEDKFVPYSSASALQNEKFAFQLAYRMDEGWGSFVQLEINSPLKEYIHTRTVELAPVRFTAFWADSDVISTKPGLYPDILQEYKGAFRIPANQWRTFWFDVCIPENLPAGKYPISFRLVNRDNAEEFSNTETFELDVLPAAVPEQKMICTHWFHADCLAVYYNVPVWSDEHWRILKNYFKNYSAHGLNMLLTPVFTPPLDTAVGGERPTTQLVQVAVKRGKYIFNFDRLEKWISLARAAGIRYFEISHLFTQWGAAFCPKIVAAVGGKEKRIFGWDTASVSEEYRDFLDAFLPELVAFLKAKKLQKYTYFHCSDEPHTDHMETYRAAVEMLRKHLKGFKICDALSSVEYYKAGLVTTPIPAENHIEDFVEAGVNPLWTYYCCGQVDKVSNRFLYMPSSRNRIMGALFYRYNIAGFLQWGYNFYYAQHSLFPIDPYQVLDSNYAFPAGDAFMVYPGKDGTPVDSLHYEVFSQALQDYRILRALESLAGREKVCELLDSVSPAGKMTMTEYPRGEADVLALREKVYSAIRENIG